MKIQKNIIMKILIKWKQNIMNSPAPRGVYAEGYTIYKLKIKNWKKYEDNKEIKKNQKKEEKKLYVIVVLVFQKVIIQHILNQNVIMIVYLSIHFIKLCAEHLNILQTSSWVLSSVK